MKNIAVFASGRGSNFLAIIQAIRRKELKAEVKLLVCDVKNAGALKIAKEYGVRVLLAERRLYPDRNAFEHSIIRELRKEKVEVIVLAGFMRILSPAFIRTYKNRILNIHPALLPSFKGANGIKDAFNYGVKVTGVTVHLVDEKVDHGPIIMQQAVNIRDKQNLSCLEKDIHAAEHILYPKAINLVLRNKIRIQGRKVRIL